MGPTRRHFRVLGPLEVTIDGSPMDVGPPRQRALLGLLAMSANRALPRERIIDALWGEQAPRTARNALQVAVHGLRRTLGPDTVTTEGESYRLVVRAGELDLDRFDQLVERAATEDPLHASVTLREALALHRGVALADVPDAPFVAIERERIEELRLLAIERRIDADLARGAGAELVAEVEALVAEHPFRERFRYHVMLALYRSGRQADALEAFRDARTSLVDELGLEPSPDLQQLHAAILRQDPSLAADGDPGPDGPPSRLPDPPNPLVGRELELAAITALVRDGTRVVTLTGIGGTGKTRLALEAARELAPDFPGGVRFVDLAPLPESRLVGPTVARVLGVLDTDDESLLERLSEAVGEKTLLVLDNLEHLLGSAPLVADIVAHVSEIQVVVTSREPLRIRVEREYRVLPLGLPDLDAVGDPTSLAANGAVALFLERALASRPDFTLTNDNAAAIVGICHALDGLPLALELAAARVRLLSPAALLERLSDRLAVLADGDRDLPDRQRTLRATMDWSYGLLEATEATLLARLAVFSGGWTIAAAEAVAHADLSSLGSLADKNLIRAETLPSGETRFSMLETVREYALERLEASGELDTIRDGHASYFGDLGERLEPTVESTETVEEIAREHGNFRLALEHSLDRGAGEVALRLCAIARFWYARGYLGEGAEWIERTLELGGGASVRRARVLYVGATIAWSSGQLERAIGLGEESLRVAREVDDRIAEVGALTALGLAHLGMRDLDTSRDYHRRGLELARGLEEDRWVAIALLNIADLEVMVGNHEEADELARESLEITRRLGDVEGTGVALLVLASSLLDRGDDDAAVPMVVESIRCMRLVGFGDFLASGLVALARARVASDPASAVRLLGAARAVRAPLGPSQFPWEQDWFDGALAHARVELGDDRTEQALDEGSARPEQTMDMELERVS